MLYNVFVVLSLPNKFERFITDFTLDAHSSREAVTIAVDMAEKAGMVVDKSVEVMTQQLNYNFPTDRRIRL